MLGKHRNITRIVLYRSPVSHITAAEIPLARGPSCTIDEARESPPKTIARVGALDLVQQIHHVTHSDDTRTMNQARSLWCMPVPGRVRERRAHRPKVF